MEKIIEKYIKGLQQKNRKRFELQGLINNVIDRYKGAHYYHEAGGYRALYNGVQRLKEKGKLKEIKASGYNGLNPPLSNRWQVIEEGSNHRWDPSKVLRYSDRLDFAYYHNHPEYQRDEEWEYIENIYAFLKSRDQRKWASVEERSLELFYDEKYLKSKKDTAKGKYGILKRLKLDYENLKMKKYGEMFIYWNKGVKHIRKIVILENHSTFFTYKRAAVDLGSIFGFEADALIYGEGKKIEESLSFLEEIADAKAMKILYFGDFDGEGLGIYHRLKTRYDELDIQLQGEAYQHLIRRCEKKYPGKVQNKNPLYLEGFLDEMKDRLTPEEILRLRDLWASDRRIPQELINYEYLLKVGR
ncbi:Wadjet anti-phage system protein JetD domain-containing protein [Isachenkonia alkalipeptolytica]|uniref:DUF2399 domain-containing protein n=1 Tax=Isachenkonia alkalipeptolytica TaxID=2565777 RepID=A0AA43XIR7_9CLOT|nr:Wadjet anti-phage system protein JetD domain-containing protein [Isachenkonia alkalipeptolytica]NBG87211.1 DUF2399 domain-containing protein [Isachenkonia alkalipeptolytica]